ncbi:MAG: porphobilinogen synthase [Deltaproteobacteria bacterium]|nr:porphobilinogen synthase [Deltaproteobacteria bacterium]MCL5276544.1 porphobilinogen synthase [Deltaproteobacteria bacterium]
MAVYPIHRGRRIRSSKQVRSLVAETRLDTGDFIYPLFITHERHVQKEIPSMPGCYQESIDYAVADAQEAKEIGIPAVILFGIPKAKDAAGSDASSETGVVQEAIREIKNKVKDIVVVADLCMCEYTSHGHCGIVEGGEVDNDRTLEYLARIAVAQAKAGVDIVAPSGMMDGMVQAIRNALDKNGFVGMPIMSYSSKYASSFYGPFRDAVESSPQFGDRRSYQMDYRNAREAVGEAMTDAEEGADIVMVKPALSYLDVIYRVRQATNLPVAAYSVSGEYSMIKAASRLGWLDEKSAMMEVLYSIKRAGADMIVTYFAKQAAKELRSMVAG